MLTVVMFYRDLLELHAKYVSLKNSKCNDFCFFIDKLKYKNYTII